MDLSYGPGELDFKDTKKGSSGSDMKREHDSVDDFEHLEPEKISPVGFNTKDLPVPEKSGSTFQTDPGLDDDLSEPFFPKSSKDDPSSFFHGSEPLATGTGFSAGIDFLSDFESGSQEAMSKPNLSMQQGLDQSHLLDFGMGGDIPSTKLDDDFESDAFSKSFISAEQDNNLIRTDKKDEISEFGTSGRDIMGVQGFSSDDGFNSKQEELKTEELLHSEDRSMKEDDALAQYNKTHEKKETDKDNLGEANIFSSTERLDDPEPVFKDLPQEIKTDSDFMIPEKQQPKPEPKQSETSKMDSTKADVYTMHDDTPIIPSSLSKLTPTSTDTTKPVSKTSAADLDDIIGPEDVFKKIGLGESNLNERSCHFLTGFIRAVGYKRNYSEVFFSYSVSSIYVSNRFL